MNHHLFSGPTTDRLAPTITGLGLAPWNLGLAGLALGLNQETRSAVASVASHLNPTTDRLAPTITGLGLAPWNLGLAGLALGLNQETRSAVASVASHLNPTTDRLAPTITGLGLAPWNLGLAGLALGLNQETRSAVASVASHLNPTTDRLAPTIAGLGLAPRNLGLAGLALGLNQETRSVLVRSDDHASAVANFPNWRRVKLTIEGAKAQLSRASTPWELQCVGVLCREVLISLAQAVFETDISRTSIPNKISPADAKGMLGAFIGTSAEGKTNRAIRKQATDAIDLANHLQHCRSATHQKAAVCVESTIFVTNLVALLAGHNHWDWLRH